MPLELIALFIGSSTGLASSFFGIGGALIGTPLVELFLHLPPHLALGTPLPAALPGAISGSTVYHKHGLINYKVALWTLLIAIPGNIVGTWLTKFTDGNALMLATAFMMFIIGGTFFVRGWLLREEKAAQEIFSVPILIGVGLLTGFLSGFLAIGGGTVMVPAFVKLLRFPLKRALATSLFCVAILAIPATIGHFMLGHIHVVFAGLIAAAAFVSAYFGAKIAIQLRNSTIEKIYGTFMTLFAVYFAYVHIIT